MNKPITLIFCNDANAGMAVAGQMRSEGVLSVQLRDAASFQGLLDDPASRVVIMPDVPEKKRAMIAQTYRGAVFTHFKDRGVEIKPDDKPRRGRPRKAI